MSAAGKSDWLQRSRFAKGPERARAVISVMETLLTEAEAGTGSPPTLDADSQRLVAELSAPLTAEPPSASQFAEAAFTLAAFCLAEDRVLNVIDPSAGDLAVTGDAKTGRLASDRGVSDKLCSELLAPRNIPATKGPLQSSSYRAGYQAEHARSRALSVYAVWQSMHGRTLAEVRAVAESLARAFTGAASVLPPWPNVSAASLTFSTYRLIRDDLLSAGSGGAFEQYLLAGLLEQEIAASDPGRRIDTKSVNANDRASKAVGDIEIRHHQALVGAIEVTAASWDTKLDQLDGAAKIGLRDITIAAAGVAEAIAEDIAAALEPIADRLGIDPAVVDLHSYMDVLAARITPHNRAEALKFTYRCLARYHSREPRLALRLIDSLSTRGVIADKEPVATPPVSESQDLDDFVAEIRAGLDRREPGESLPEALRRISGNVPEA